MYHVVVSVKISTVIYGGYLVYPVYFSFHDDIYNWQSGDDENVSHSVSFCVSELFCFYYFMCENACKNWMLVSSSTEI